MNISVLCILLALLMWPVGNDGLTRQSSLLWWSPARRGDQLRYERELNSSVSARSLAGYHELFTSMPHHAGSAGDQEMARLLVAAFEKLGILVEKQNIWPYLAEPIDASVQIVSATGAPPAEGYPLSLPLQEAPMREDPSTSHPQLPVGWSAYSGNGDVTSQVVYANRGTIEDFKFLKDNGIDPTGKVVLVRTGGIFRGLKAKNAQQSGAAALLMYPDPADVGYGKGPSYPAGGWANGNSIERGTVMWIDRPGDPRTPGREARQWTRRASISGLDLPSIPVQPMGWEQASQIMSRMNGAKAPESWQGQLPFSYRLTGGPELSVRVKVEQQRKTMMVTNVLGIVPGAVFPEEMIVIGCHYDAWTFGAGDPHAGTIVLYEAARAFAEAAKAGQRPDRTVVFANWAAEEFGIIGSTEYVEAYEEKLGAKAIAYINLDMAAMGPNLGMSASPTLRAVAAAASQSVPQAGGKDDQTAYDLWSDQGTKLPFGNLGGGSDHVPFVGRLCIPAIGLGASGSDGSSYHTAYDTLTWYRKTVGADYQPAVMLTRLVNVIAARLSNADVLPLDPSANVQYTLDALDVIKASAQKKGLSTDFNTLIQQIDDFAKMATSTQEKITVAIETGRMKRGGLADRANSVLLAIERAWMTADGLPGRTWFRNLQVAPNPITGYGSWALPALQQAVASGDQDALDAATELYVEVFRKLGDLMYKLNNVISRWDMR